MIEILTAVLVLITGVYAWLTFRISRANERATQAVLDQNESLTRPYVVVRPFVAPMSLFFLTIENTGMSPAQDLKITIDRSFYCMGREADDLAATHLFTEVTRTFAPGESVTYFLGQRHEIFSDKADRSQIPLDFRITARYSFGVKTVTEERVVDLRQYYDIVEVKPSEMQALQEISRSFSRLVSVVERTERQLQQQRRDAVPHNKPLHTGEGQEPPGYSDSSRLQRFIQDISAALRG